MKTGFKHCSCLGKHPRQQPTVCTQNQLSYIYWHYTVFDEFHLQLAIFTACIYSVVYGRGGFTPPPKFRSFNKVEPDCKLSEKCLVFLFQHPNYLKIAEFRMPTPQDVRKKGSKILKLPGLQLFYICNGKKLVVIINSLKVPKLRTFHYKKMKFLVPNYSCLQNPRVGGYCPHIPVLSIFLPQLNLLNPSRKKFLGTPLHILWNYNHKINLAITFLQLKAFRFKLLSHFCLLRIPY